MNPQERNALLQEMKELKSEFSIGSLNAFKYLKATRWLEDLLRQIHARNPALTERHNLTIPVVAWFVLTTKSLLGRLLQITSARVSTPENCSIGSEHVFAPLDLHPYGDVGIQPHTRVWLIDYATLITFFLTCVPRGLGAEATQRLLFGFLSYLFESNWIPIRSARTEEYVRYSEFCKKSEYKGGGTRNAWVWADYLATLDEELITDEERVILEKALDRQDLPVAHPILQRAEIKHILETPFSGMDEGPCCSPVTEDWLYDTNLYDRAEREYTLGHVHIQRGIVLSEVHKWTNGNNEFPSPGEFVDQLIANQFEKIRRSADRMSQFRAMNAPPHQAKEEERILRKRRYLYTALRQNRPWLVQFLSR